jgi:hypothetical protein
MRAPLLAAAIAAFATATGAAAQSLNDPSSGLSSPGLPGLSSPGVPTLSPGFPTTLPSLGAPQIGSLSPGSALSSPRIDGLGMGTLSASAPGIGIPATTAPLGSASTSSIGLASAGTRSPFDDGLIFVGQPSSSLLGGPALGGPSTGLLDFLAEPSGMDPFALDRLPPAPGVGVSSSATFGGGSSFDNRFCRPEDFTCN